MTFTTNKTTTKLNHLEPRAHEKNCVCGTCYVCAVRCTVHMICPPCPRLRHHLEQVARHAVVDDQVSRRPGALEERRLIPPCPVFGATPSTRVSTNVAAASDAHVQHFTTFLGSSICLPLPDGSPSLLLHRSSGVLVRLVLELLPCC